MTRVINDDVRKEVMREIYDRLDIDPKDESIDSLGRVYRLLSKEMSEAILTGVDLKPIKSALGQEGELRPDLYVIKFEADLKKELSRRRLFEHEVRLTTSEPDRFEHLLPEHFGSSDQAVSLYTRDFPKPDPYTILCQTRRTGNLQTISTAWKLYHSDVHLSASKAPIEHLHAFIEKYGIPIQVGDEIGTFFLYKRIPFFGGSANVAAIPGSYPHDTELRAFMLAKRTEVAVEVALGYGINMTRYYADLRAHN